jgi:F0F1-type ATP synthase membrane subunit b/b'
LKSEGTAEEQRILKETHSMVEDRINKAKAELNQKRREAREALQKEIGGFSSELTKKILGRGI